MSLHKSSDMPTKVGRTFTGGQQQFWLDVLPVDTNDSYEYW